MLPDVSSAVYSTAGCILFLREGVLSAAPFDAKGGRLTGEVISLGENVTISAGTHRASMSIADNNMLALRQAMPFDDLGQVRWVDRHGAIANIGTEQTYFGGSASPDGRFAAVTINDVKTGSADIWILDSAGNARQLTTSREWQGYPVWSADGRRIAYVATSAVGAAVLVRDLEGGEPTTAHESKEGVLLPRSWSADGRYLLVNRVAVRGRTPDIFVLSLETGQLSPYLDSPAAEFLGSFSPDGRFVTYMSNEGGPTETWVTGFPTPTGKRRIATNGGPVGWSADGKEILVWGFNADVSAVPVTIGHGQIVAGSPTVAARSIRGLTASPTRDHSRLLTIVRPDPEQGVAEIQLLAGWVDRVRR
jgi:dipeptidyl aminopeptidase/acylaminoacyl peptidase